ncbi:MAG: hypothetical protein ABI651_02615 [Verrucomicrobiota bacterium]
MALPNVADEPPMGEAPPLVGGTVQGYSELAQQFPFCGARLCAKHSAKHQPQRVDTLYGAEVLRLVGMTQPPSGSK